MLIWTPRHLQRRCRRIETSTSSWAWRPEPAQQAVTHPSCKVKQLPSTLQAIFVTSHLIALPPHMHCRGNAAVQEVGAWTSHLHRAWHSSTFSAVAPYHMPGSAEREHQEGAGHLYKTWYSRVAKALTAGWADSTQAVARPSMGAKSWHPGTAPRGNSSRELPPGRSRMQAARKEASSAVSAESHSLRRMMAPSSCTHRRPVGVLWWWSGGAVLSQGSGWQPEQVVYERASTWSVLD